MPKLKTISRLALTCPLSRSVSAGALPLYWPSGGAYLCMQEDERGALERGKLADMIVPEDNPLTCEADRLQHIAPALTIAGGRIVYEAMSQMTPPMPQRRGTEGT